MIPLTVSKDGSYHTSFVIYIRDAKHEGLYSMFFHNCYNYFHKYDFNWEGAARTYCYDQLSRSRSQRLPVKFDINIEEKNSDSYLSAGYYVLKRLKFRFHPLGRCPCLPCIRCSLFYSSSPAVSGFSSSRKMEQNRLSKLKICRVYYICSRFSAYIGSWPRWFSWKA